MPLLDFSRGMTGEIKKNTQLVFDPNYFEDPLMENEVELVSFAFHLVHLSRK